MIVSQSFVVVAQQSLLETAREATKKTSTARLLEFERNQGNFGELEDV